MTRRAYAAIALAIAFGCNGKDAGRHDTGGPSAGGEVQVYINEFLASNGSGLQDESGAYPDWIELYNAGEREVDLTGYWLTDDLSDKLKWQFPAGVTIPAGGYLVLFADGDTKDGDLHVSFSLDRLGEDLGLFGPSSQDNPQIDAIEDYDPQATDQSTARVPDGANTWVLDPTPTPDAPNDGAR